MAETILITAYVFSAPRYDMPYWPEGGFVFEATPRAVSGGVASSAPVAPVRWVFSAAEARGSRARFGPGPAYVFTLSLKDAGASRAVYDLGSVELRGWFETPSGERVSTTGEATVRVGRVGA